MTVSVTSGTPSTVPPGVYALSESSVFDYQAGTWGCIGGTPAGPTSIQLFTGNNALCIINNFYNSTAPSIISITPSAEVARGQTIPITIHGVNFEEGSSVLYDGNPAAVTYISPNELRIENIVLPASVAADTPVQIYVLNSDGRESNTVEFHLLPNTPIITDISPASTTEYHFPFTLTVNGNNFWSGSQVQISIGTTGIFLPRTTTYVSPQRLTIAFAQSELAGATGINVRVCNPVTGGAPSCSNLVFLRVDPLPPGPYVREISPTSMTAGGTGNLTLTVYGRNFGENSTVTFNGEDMATTYVNPGQVTAVIPGAMLMIEGLYPVRVKNSYSTYDFLSNAKWFSVNAPIGAAALSVSSGVLEILNRLSELRAQLGKLF